MMILELAGFWQCRFATDPDPADEPRGLTGPTFATHSEPDLDRTIRSAHPVSPRFPKEDQIGVRVTGVSIDGVDQPDHPFVGGLFDFLDDAQFVQLNWIITPGFKAPIDPLHIEVQSKDGTIRLRRKDEWVISEPGLTIYDVFTDPNIMARRDNTYAARDPEVAEATGILDYAGYRLERRRVLAERLSSLKQDDPERADLQQRIANLDRDATQQGVTFGGQEFLGLRCDYDIQLNGEVSGDHLDQLDGQLGTSQFWPFTFWFGGYDVDLMTGYMKGSLEIPFAPNKG